jgi:hypothetical protein
MRGPCCGVMRMSWAGRLAALKRSGRLGDEGRLRSLVPEHGAGGNAEGQPVPAEVSASATEGEDLSANGTGTGWPESASVRPVKPEEGSPPGGRSPL